MQEKRIDGSVCQGPEGFCGGLQQEQGHNKSPQLQSNRTIMPARPVAHMDFECGFKCPNKSRLAKMAETKLNHFKDNTN